MERPLCNKSLCLKNRASCGHSSVQRNENQPNKLKFKLTLAAEQHYFSSRILHFNILFTY
jgi:hypothetical protein